MKKIKAILKTPAAVFLAVVSTLLVPVFLTTAPVAMTGCATTGGGTNDPAQIAAVALILQNTARAGTVAAITPPTGDTNNAAYFNAAAETIGLFITGKDYSPAAFQQALIDIKMPQANNLWVQLGIASVIDLYQVYFSEYSQAQLGTNSTAVIFLGAIQTGFNQALGKAVPPPLPQLARGPATGILPRPRLKK